MNQELIKWLKSYEYYSISEQVLCTIEEYIITLDPRGRIVSQSIYIYKYETGWWTMRQGEIVSSGPSRMPFCPEYIKKVASHYWNMRRML